MFAIEFRSLELSEHQNAMLETPESRIAKLIFPASIRDRATRSSRRNRKSKWSEESSWAGRARRGPNDSKQARTARTRPEELRRPGRKGERQG